MNLNKWNNKTSKRSAQSNYRYLYADAGLSRNHAHTCRHRMFEQHAGSHTQFI